MEVEKDGNVATVGSPVSLGRRREPPSGMAAVCSLARRSSPGG